MHINGKREAKQFVDAAKNGLLESTSKIILMSDTTLEKLERMCDE